MVIRCALLRSRSGNAGRRQEDDVLRPLQEPEVVRRVDLLPLERGLESEVEVRERLDRGIRIPTMPTTDSDKPIGDSERCRSPWRSGDR